MLKAITYFRGMKDNKKGSFLRASKLGGQEESLADFLAVLIPQCGIAGLTEDFQSSEVY